MDQTEEEEYGLQLGVFEKLLGNLVPRAFSSFKICGPTAILNEEKAH